jgi:hypothetical protein
MEPDDIVDNIINFTAELEFFIKIFALITLVYTILFLIIAFSHCENFQLSNLTICMANLQESFSLIRLICIVIVSISITFLHYKAK